MHITKQNLRWSTRNVYVDMDTGEILNVSNEIQLNYINYYQVNKTKKIETNEESGVIIYTNECRKSGQREIKFSE